ncbi:TPA: hypothetical protein ACGOV9_001561 [Streptococcus suis]
MIGDKENHFYFYKTSVYYKLAGITLVTAIITGWALDSIVILGILLVSGLLFGFFTDDEEGL